MLFLLNEEEYLEKRFSIEDAPNFRKINLTEEEFNKARIIQEKNKTTSFFDVIHIILAKKTKSILITRDNALIKLAEKYTISAKKPEEI